MNVSDYWREQSRKRRFKARETGRCIICMTRQARPDRVTCERCCAAATAATKRRRGERRAASIAAAPVVGRARLAQAYAGQESLEGPLNGAA